MYTKVSVFSRYHFVVEHIFNFPQRYTMMATLQHVSQSKGIEEGIENSII